MLQFTWKNQCLTNKVQAAAVRDHDAIIVLCHAIEYYRFYETSEHLKDSNTIEITENNTIYTCNFSVQCNGSERTMVIEDFSYEKL